jgi:hypothetical protein
MNQAEMRLVEQGWEALVERLGPEEAVRFVMLLDRRTGAGLQYLRSLWSTPASRKYHRSIAPVAPQSISPFDS